MITSPAAAAEYPHLLSPFRLGTVELRNRFVFQPHFTALMGDDSMPNAILHDYFVERARGGAGLIVDGHMTVMVEGMMAPHYIKAWEEGFIPAYRAIVDDVHAQGARIIGQVTHAGHTSLTEPPPILWAPTQMPEPSSHHTTRAMDLDDIARAVRGFGDAARNIIATGADGIEVKIAHDGLLRSFASPFFNQRTDAYGGSFEKRMRLPLECLASIRDAVGPDVPVGIRLCLNEYTPFGYDLEYGLRMAEAFESSGLVDYFNSDAGTFSSFWMEIPPAAVEQGFFRPLNRALKAQSSLPIVAFGRIKQPAMAERILELGEADLIGMARALIADADLPRKLTEGRAEEIRACIGCNDGVHPPGRPGQGHPMHPEPRSGPGAAVRRTPPDPRRDPAPRRGRGRRPGRSQGGRDRGATRAPGHAPGALGPPGRAGPARRPSAAPRGGRGGHPLPRVDGPSPRCGDLDERDGRRGRPARARAGRDHRGDRLPARPAAWAPGHGGGSRRRDDRAVTRASGPESPARAGWATASDRPTRSSTDRTRPARRPS